MSKLIKIPSLSDALKEIHSLHDKILESGRNSVADGIRIGELLTGLKAGLKHGQWLQWTKSNLSFSDKTAQRYQHLYKCRSKFVNVTNLAGAYKLLFGGTVAHVSNNSGDNEWYTPEPFIGAARAVMETIDCDPASSAIANETVKATKFYTKEQDGLNHQWNGNVWMNPPYAAELIGKFAEAVASKFESGEIQQAIALVNNATETEWFARMAGCCSAVCFPEARVKFLDPDGNPGAPLQGQAILYLGKRTKQFIQNFSAFGFVLCRP